MRLTGQSVPRRCFHLSSIQMCNHCPPHEPAPLQHTEKTSRYKPDRGRGSSPPRPPATANFDPSCLTLLLFLTVSAGVMSVLCAVLIRAILLRHHGDVGVPLARRSDGPAGGRSKTLQATNSLKYPARVSPSSAES